MNQAGTQEIRREKVFIPEDMNPKEIREKYGVHKNTACSIKKKDTSSGTT